MKLLKIITDFILIYVFYNVCMKAHNIIDYIFIPILLAIFIFIHLSIWNNSIMCKLFGHLDNGSDRCVRCKYPLRRKK